MAKVCDPTDSIPATCAEAFSALRVGQARVEEKIDRLVEKADQSREHVHTLYSRADNAAKASTALSNRVAALESVRKKGLARVWQLVTIALAAIAGALAGKFIH